MLLLIFLLREAQVLAADQASRAMPAMVVMVAFTEALVAEEGPDLIALATLAQAAMEQTESLWLQPISNYEIRSN
jgi:hypothetical protein